MVRAAAITPQPIGSFGVRSSIADVSMTRQNGALSAEYEPARNASPVSSAGGGERTLDHDQALAWPVPFAFLAGSDQSVRKEIAGSFRTPVVS